MNLLYRHYLKEELKEKKKRGFKQLPTSQRLAAQSFVDKGIACSAKMS